MVIVKNILFVSILLLSSCVFSENITYYYNVSAGLLLPADGYQTYSRDVQLSYKTGLSTYNETIIDQIKKQNLEVWMFTDHSGSMSEFSNQVGDIFDDISWNINQSDTVNSGRESMETQGDPDQVDDTIHEYIDRVKSDWKQDKEYHAIIVGDGGEEDYNFTYGNWFSGYRPTEDVLKEYNIKMHFLQLGDGPVGYQYFWNLWLKAVPKVIGLAKDSGGQHRNWTYMDLEYLQTHADDISIDILEMVLGEDEDEPDVFVGPRDVYCDLYLDDEMIESRIAKNESEEIFTATSLGYGWHEWRVECDDVVTQEWRFEVLEKIEPSVLLVSPEDGYKTYSDEVDLQFIYHRGTEGDSRTVCDIFLDGEMYEKIDVEDGIESTYLATGLEPREYEWNVSCGDAISKTWHFEVIRLEHPYIELKTPHDGYMSKDPDVDFDFTYHKGTFEPEEIECEVLVDEESVGKVMAKDSVITGLGGFGFSRTGHRWRVECSDILSDSWMFTILDLDPPIVELISPFDGHETLQRDLEFLYIYDKQETGLHVEQCWLVIDGSRVGSALSTSGEIDSIFQEDLGLGNHRWNVECGDARSQDWDFFIAKKYPYVRLISVYDGFRSEDPDIRLKFVYVAGDQAVQIGDCTLFVDGVEVDRFESKTTIPVIKKGEYELGVHRWNVECNQGTDEYAESGIWTFEIIEKEREGMERVETENHRPYDVQRYGGRPMIVNLTAQNRTYVYERYWIQIFESDDVTVMPNLTFHIMHEDLIYPLKVAKTDDNGSYIYRPKRVGMLYYRVPGYYMKNNTTTSVILRPSRSGDDYEDGLFFALTQTCSFGTMLIWLILILTALIFSYAHSRLKQMISENRKKKLIEYRRSKKKST